MGVIVDDKLLWNEHIDSITIRASKGLGMLRRMKPFLPRSILVTIYKSLILPYLDYCCLVWDNCSNYLHDNLQKIQNRAARIITGESYEIRSSDLLRKLNWPNLKERRSHKKAIFMFEVKNEQVAQSVAELFSVANNENHGLRSNNKTFLTDKPKTNFLKKTLVILGQATATIYQEVLKQRGSASNNSELCSRTEQLNKNK